MNAKLILLSLMICTNAMAATYRARPLPVSPARIAEQVNRQASLQQLSMNRGQQHDFEQLRSNKWEYWSMGVGVGAGLMYVGDLDGTVHRVPLPDYRISIERSWYLTDQFTAMLDISLLTPSLRLGYIVSDSTRVFCGMGLWLLGSYGINLLFSNLDKANMSGGKMAIKDLHSIKAQSRLTVSPSIGLDHFLSKNCFLRVAVSYDQVRLAVDKARAFTLHWPQVMASLNFRF